MPLSALERLQQLKTQGSPTGTKKSALDRIRELRIGYKEPASLPSSLPTQAQSPIRQASSPFTMAKQNNILTNPSVLSNPSTFNVPEKVRPMPEQSTGDIVKGVATGLVKTGGEAAIRLAGQMNPIAKAVSNFTPEEINLSQISADIAKSSGLSQQEIDDRLQNLPDVIKQDISIKYSKDPKKALGQLLNDATWVAGGGTAGTVTKIANPFVRGAVLPIAGAVEGGAISSASATGTALQEGKTFRDSLNEGKKAFLPGAALGAVLSPLAIVATLSKAEKTQMATKKNAKAEQKIAQKQQKIVKKVTEGWDSALDVRTNRLQRFEEAEGKTLPEVMVEQQLPGLKKNKQGYIDAKATEQGAREAVQKLETTKQEIFGTRNQADIDIDKLATEAKRKINDPSDRNYIVNAEDALKSADDIDNYVNAFKARENTSVLNVKQADMAKKGAWESAYEDLRPTKDKALRVFGNVLKDNIESKFVAESQNIIRQINKEEGSLLGVIKALDVKGGKGVHGRVIRGGVLGKKFDELAGGYIGSISGIPILGPIAGMKTAEMLNTYRYNPTRLTKNAIRDLQKVGLMPKWIKTEAEGRTFLKSKQAENLINSYTPKRLELPPAKEGAPRFGGGAVPETGGVIGIPQRKMTQFDKPANKIGGVGQNKN